VTSATDPDPSPPFHWFNQACDYWVDSLQRTVLFWDVLRRRGNEYLAHLAEGQPPVLVFDHETILDARTFERPVNYALVRILDRRCPECPGRSDTAPAAGDPRRRTRAATGAPAGSRRPIVIIDPRAGHGPGIGGSKQESQIGMALDAGHPVYFMIFFTEPEPGQTLVDVRNAQIRFVEEVRRRHPDAPRPAVIGNCQGGWAAALIGAERPDLVGPMVFNGSPLSYWGGVEGAHPLRYRGGLLGGVWVNSLWSDLGNGRFDGAHLVANFEDLNPANTLWGKLYHLYANVDTETGRFLDFERWWGGFFLLSDEEIHTIVEELFVGNRLEQGELELETGRKVDLKNNTNPVVVFASFGDNITPPQQAFNWIAGVYGSVEEIRRRGQVIVVHLHESVGHLGIFVSAKIARREHREIIASFDMLDYLPPGLYEMIIEPDPHEPGEHQVRYVEKTTDDLHTIETGRNAEPAFHAAAAVSRANDFLYRTLLAPWINLAVDERLAEALRQLHPLRMQRTLLSDANPWLAPVNMWAALIGRCGLRQPTAQDNPFRELEARVSDGILEALNRCRDLRDGLSEALFKAIYESPWVWLLYALDETEAKEQAARLEGLRRRDANHWRKEMSRGGFAEAATRMLLAVMLADRDVDSDGYRLAGRLFRSDERLKHFGPQQIQELVRAQARILQTDTDQAIAALPALLPAADERRRALALLREAVAAAERPPNEQERAVLETISAVLAV
jgi:pimeloyl-ACP methyl ester carboxylesterase/tellurite resistance protein